MAVTHELNVKSQGPLSDESKGLIPYGELIRDYEPDPDVKWRFGKPNYARVNQAYFTYRSKVHPEGSLEAIVNKIVKNWEVESHHLANPDQWKTMDSDKFRCAVNGGAAVSAKQLAEAGPYNVLLGDTPLYAGSKLSYDESNKNFSSTFPEGFAWECLEVMAGPPVVTFKWRHFGKFSGTFTDKQGRKYIGNGRLMELYGMCIAKVNDQLQIIDLDVYYNPEDMLVPLTTTGDAIRVVGGDEGDGKAVGNGCASPACGASPTNGKAQDGGCSLM